MTIAKTSILLSWGRKKTTEMKKIKKKDCPSVAEFIQDIDTSILKSI